MTCTSAGNAFSLVRLHDFIACSLTPPPRKSYFHTKRLIMSTFPLLYPFRMYVSAIFSAVTPGPTLSRGITLFFPPPQKNAFISFLEVLKISPAEVERGLTRPLSLPLRKNKHSHPTPRPHTRIIPKPAIAVSANDGDLPVIASFEGRVGWVVEKWWSFPQRDGA